MKRYRHLFFDLDHTLWDFTTNSREVLIELHAELHLEERGIPQEDFISVYESVNTALWQRYDTGGIPKELLRTMRFRHTLAHFKLKDARLVDVLDKRYMDRCPDRTALNPGALDLLRELQPHFRMHIITNGFLETQTRKMKASGIRQFFDVVLTSEQAGASKPSARIFRHALRSAGAKPQESLMIGDNARADIGGARLAGIDQAHYIPFGEGDKHATYRFTHFGELRFLLNDDAAEGDEQRA